MAKSAITLTVLSVLTPLIGLAVESAVAWRFGASATVDAYRTAYLIINFGMALFFGQLLPSIVVPLVAEHCAKGEEELGWRLAFSVGQITALLALPAVFYAWLEPNAFVDLLAPGLHGRSRAEASSLMLCCTVAFVLTVFSGVINGILLTYKVFVVGYGSQALANLILAFAVVKWGAAWGSASLAAGILGGSIGVLFVHLFYLFRRARISGVRLLHCLGWGSASEILPVLWRSVPIMSMIAATQLSVVVMYRVLSGMPIGSIATFGYAWKLLVPVALVSTTLATTVFPWLSEAEAVRNAKARRSLIRKSIRVTFLLASVLTGFLFATRRELVEVLFWRGAMDANMLAQISHYFGLALVHAPAGALMLLLPKLLIATKDSKSALSGVLIASLPPVLLMSYIGRVGGVPGVIWLINISNWLAVIWLAVILERKGNSMRLTDFVATMAANGLLAMGVAGIGSLLHVLFVAALPFGFLRNVLQIAVSVPACGMAAFWLARVLKIEEAVQIRDHLVKRFSGRVDVEPANARA